MAGGGGGCVGVAGGSGAGGGSDKGGNFGGGGAAAACFAGGAFFSVALSLRLLAPAASSLRSRSWRSGDDDLLTLFHSVETAFGLGIALAAFGVATGAAALLSGAPADGSVAFSSTAPFASAGPAFFVSG